MNEAHCLPLAEETDESLSVTLIDANHCPGAVMFLFEGYFGRILYTGDFRYSQTLNCEESFSRVCSSAVDKLYLDNTFCSPRCDFPSREKAMVEMLRIISEHPDHRVMIGLRKLGKEGLLVAIAKHFRMQICVTKERLHRLELLQVPNVFTTVESETRIRVVDQGQISETNMNAWNKEMPTLAIIPTALYRVINVNKGLNRGDVFVVPYSDHSSFSELCEFVAVVGPREVIPILTGVKDRLGKIIPERGDMSCFAEYLDKTPALGFCSPIDFTVIKKEMARSCPRVTNGSVPGTKVKKFKFKHVVRPKGVVYEHTSADEQSQNCTPLTVNNVNVGNTDARTNEQELGSSKGMKKVEENGLIDKTSVYETNAKYRRTCVAESVDIWKQKNAQAQLEHEEVFRNLKANETTNGFNFCQTGSELVLLSVPPDECEDDRKCRERDSKKLVGKEDTEYTDSFNICRDSCDLTFPIRSSHECEDGLKYKECSSEKLVGKEVKGNVDIFKTSRPSVTSNEHEDLECVHDSSRCHLGKEIKVNMNNFLKTGSDQTVSSVPSNECEGVLKFRQSNSLLGIDDNNVGSYSVAESIAVSPLPSGGSEFNNCQTEDNLFVMQCSESDGKVTLGVINERLELSDLILQSLQPIFEEEAQSMFQSFLRAQNKQ